MKRLIIADDGTTYTSLALYVINFNVVTINWVADENHPLVALITNTISETFNRWNRPTEAGKGRLVEFVHNETTGEVSWTYNPSQFSEIEVADIREAVKLLQSCLIT